MTTKKGHTWNHRVVRHKHGELAIHEAHYSPSRTKTPNLITQNPVAVWGSSKKELRETLERMLRALDTPVLSYGKYVKESPGNLVTKKK